MILDFGPVGRAQHLVGGVPEAQKARIYFGMAEAVAQKGYGATTVADVLERARVSRRSFYELYRDKEDCFLCLYDHAH